MTPEISFKITIYIAQNWAWMAIGREKWGLTE